ncbi:hypothetical protein ACFCX0_41385 [Streptomyces sp. NPDC056352]
MAPFSGFTPPPGLTAPAGTPRSPGRGCPLTDPSGRTVVVTVHQE